MTKESNLWKHLKSVMEGRWHAQRHEDKFQPGIPDVDYGYRGVNGWIELKVAQEWWPKRGGPLPSLWSTDQVRWLKRRWEHGGPVFSLIQVPDDGYWLANPMLVYDIHTGQVYKDAFEAAAGYMNRLQEEPLRWALLNMKKGSER